jgi:DNA repair photolyase
MVSLGPLSPKRYCTYQCAFCYVQKGYKSYGSMSPKEIVDYLRSSQESFDIVYVSGDTDSFAAPRTDLGIYLLESLIELEVDLMFTTRTKFESKQIERIGKIAEYQNKSNRLLFGCISIPRLDSASHLESNNTPSPRERVETLRALKEHGLVSVLTLRPFLPIIPINEYINIITLSQSFTDIVLGEVWYVDLDGMIEKQVFQGPTPEDITFKIHRMDFDENQGLWKVWEGREVQESIESYCRNIGKPFFMRSGPAVELMRKLCGR